MSADLYPPIILSSLLLGLAGGFGHCVGMCSPFVLYISSKFAPPSQNYRLLIPHIKYNMGRITTYTLLGIMIGAAGNLSLLNNHLAFQKIITITAGSILILLASLNILNIHTRIKLPFVQNFSKLPFHRSPYLTGVALGFLPCGLVAGALITSAVSTNALVGGVAMAVFGLGTSVSLMLVALFGGLFLKYMPPAKIIFNILLLISGTYFLYKGIMFR